MGFKVVPLLIVLGAWAVPSWCLAESVPQSVQSEEPNLFAALIAVGEFQQMVRQLRDEASLSALSMEGDFFARQADGEWRKKVEALYDFSAIWAKFTVSLEESLQNEPDVAKAALEFYGSPLGQRLIAADLKTSALFMQQEEVEAAEVAVERAQEARDPRLVLIDQLIEEARFVEINVLSALKASRLFERGYDEGLAPSLRRTEEELVQQLGLTEPEVRAETQLWLRAFFYRAYGPLSDQDLRDLLAYYRSEKGRKMIDISFSAYEAAFDEVTQQLGAMVGRIARGQLI